MICTRCNNSSNDAETCPICGTQLKTLASQKLRGWFALGAAAFLGIFMAAIWIWIDRLFAAQGIAARDAAAGKFLWRINAAFALIVVSGGLGVINGWTMAHSGKRNLWLLVALLVAFLGGLIIAGVATSSYRGS
jgi:prepilin signal peptidase PulO-like enzyme (type II secretory pathway)